VDPETIGPLLTKRFMTNCKIKARWWRSAPWTPFAAALLLATLLVTSGCVRSTVTTSSVPLFGAAPSQRTTPAAATAHPAPQAQPDDAVGQAVLKQTKGAFNPLTDDKTVATLQTRLRLEPQNVAARLQLAGIFERYALDEQALDHYKQALSFATQNSETGAAVPPEAEAAALGVARCARALGQNSEAIAALEDFARRRPTAGVWNELGTLYDDGRELAAAEQVFRQAVAREPDSWSIHNNLGYNLLLQNQTDAAEAEFRRALELNPKSSTARNNLGVVLARRGESEAALQQFRLASSDLATAHNNLAVVLLEMGYYERGRNELVKALSERYYFAPPMENYKLAQELLRQRAEVLAAGSNLPLSNVRIPPMLALATGSLNPLLELDRRSPQNGNGSQTKAP